MDLKEAANKLNISETTARRWIKIGKLQANLVDGPYGPQYEIDKESIERAKNNQNVPIIVHSDNPMLTMEDITKAIYQVVNEGITINMNKVEQGLHQEIEGLKSELEKTKNELLAERENQRRMIEERDQKLLEAIRSIQQRQKEEAERREQERNRFWWQKIFGR